MNPVLIIRTEIINIIILLYLIVYNRRCKKYRKGKDDFIWFALLSIMHCIFGHVEGDRMIAAAAQTLRDSLKRADNIFRIGENV